MANGTRGVGSQIEGYLRAGGRGAKQCMHFSCGRILCSLVTQGCTSRALKILCVTASLRGPTRRANAKPCLDFFGYWINIDHSQVITGILTLQGVLDSD